MWISHATVGRLEIHGIADARPAPVDPERSYPDVPRAAWVPHRRWLTPDGQFQPDLGCFLVKTPDGVVLIGQHLGGGYSLLKWIDPSVVDESEPNAVDPSLDMYEEDNGFRVPPEPSSYSTEFLDRYRAAQHSRVRRLEHLAREAIGSRSAGGVPGYMRIARVVADPAFTDLSIEPDDRDVCSFANDPRPDLANHGLGYIPAVTPEAFLSTWCEFTTRTRTAECIRHVADPLLVVHYAGDSATRISEARRVFENSPATDREFVLVRHADHFGFRILGPHQRGGRVSTGTDAVVRWMRAHFPL